jgi:serine protease Do
VYHSPGDRLSPAPARRPLARAASLDADALRRPWLLALALALTVLVLATGAAQARGTPDGFADLAERLAPAVVNISTTQSIPQDRGPEMPQFPPGSPFDEFFKEFFDRHGGGEEGSPRPPRRATSLGSGFIIDPDGYIVTNNHVIADAEEVTVILNDDTVLKADIVGRDAKVDVALLKVKADKRLPYVDWGNSDKARVGDWVMAIGNPFGLGGTVTAGIISAKTRDINAGPYDAFIQTDASINRGNSGGPLFNMAGEVVGINTAIFSPTGGSVGIGFATPSNLAKQVLEDIRKFGRTRRGWLGVRIQTMTDEIADSLGLKRPEGALVASVTPDSPAAKAGIEPGDVILEFNDQDVHEMRRLPAMVAETEIGSEVPVTVWRDEKRRDLSVTIAELEEEDEEVAEAPDQQPSASPEQSAVEGLGLAVAPLTPEVRQHFSVPDDANGVLVTDIETSGPAAEKGLRPGDVIAEVNQTPIASAAEIQAQVDKAREAGRKSVLLLIQNATGMRFVALNLAAPD